jgi:hypothetical protein
VRPGAIVVPDTAVLVEIAVLDAVSFVLTGNVSEKHLLGVVAGPQTIGILHVHEAVAVVVQTVPAVVEVILAGGQLTGRLGIGAAGPWRASLSVA